MALNFLNDGYFAGKVGIGTDVPGSNLDIKSAMGTSGEFSAAQLRLDSSDTVDTTGFQGIRFATSTAVNYGWTIGANRSSNGRGSFRFFEHNNSLVGTERFTLEQDGNVGIGTPNPGVKLDVADVIRGRNSIRVDGAATGSPYFGLYQNGSEKAYIQYVDSGDNLTVQSDGVVTLKTGSTEKMRITSGGNVGIGTTSPDQKLTVNGSVKYNTQITTLANLGQKAFIGISSGSGAQKFKIYKNTNTTDGYARFTIDRAYDYGDNNQMVQEAVFQRRNTTKNFVFKYEGDVATGDDVYLEVYELSNGQVEIWFCVDDFAQSIIEVISNPGTSEIFTSPSAGTPTGTLIHSSNPDTETPNWDSYQGDGYFAGNVGIGTTSPTSELHIEASDNPNLLITRAGVNKVLLGDSGSNNGGDLLLYNTSGTLTTLIRSGSNSYLNGGNVGIGTTSPGGKLEVDGTYGDLKIGDPSVGTQITYYDTTRILMNSTDIKFYTNSLTERMTIESNGNVGIGTDSPKQKLHVSGGTTAGDVTKMVIGATGGNAESYLYLAELFSGDNVNYGFSFVADGNSSNNLLFKRHSNSTSGTTVMEIRRDNDQIRFNGYSGTNQTGTPTYILGTTSGGDIVKVLGGNIPIAAPAAPSTVTSTIVGETIEIEFNQSSTSNIDYYQVWSSDDGGDYGIIGQIAPVDFSSTMTVVDTTFVTGGTMSYRVYAVKTGIYSSAATTSKSYTVSALSVTAMTVVNLNTAYYIQYEKPVSRFIDHIEIYMDSQTTLAALNRNNASIVYSGQNASYMRNVNTSNNFHQFWVEVVTT